MNFKSHTLVGLLINLRRGLVKSRFFSNIMRRRCKVKSDFSLQGIERGNVKCYFLLTRDVGEVR